jgi:hypothetical protein
MHASCQMTTKSFSIARWFTPLLVIELNFGHHYACIKGFNLEFENFKIDVYGLDCGR